MTIQHFGNEVDAVQLDKGFTFYKSDLIEDCSEKEKGHWQAVFRGSGYQVMVELKDQEITNTVCNCPENLPHCKHIVATLYTIHYGPYNAENKDIQVPPKPVIVKPVKVERPPMVIPKFEKVPKVKEVQPKPEKISTKETFRDLVNKIPEDELREFIVSHSEKDKIFRNILHANFVDKSILQGREAYATIIKRASDTIKDDRYATISKSLKPVGTLLERAEEAINREEYKMAAEIIYATIDKMQDLVEMMRDGRGGMDEYIEQAFKLLFGLLAKDIPERLKAHIFEETITEMSFAKYKRAWFGDYWKKILIATAYNDELKARIG